MDIVLSYIIPFYQGEDTIDKCLDSIYNIGLCENDFEIIVVDDASPCLASKVLQSYLYVHKNLHIVRHEKNKRQGGAKNTGIRYAQGTYIAFADQDDIVIAKNIHQALSLALETNVSMLACNYVVQYQDFSTKEFGLNLGKSMITTGRDFCENYFDGSINLAPWAYLYNRAFLLHTTHPYAENVTMEDADWIAWHLIHAPKIAVCNTAIYCWCMNPLSITHSQCYINRADWIYFGYRKIKDAELYRDISNKFANIMIEDGRYNIIGGMKKVWKVDDYCLFYRRITPILSELQEQSWPRMVGFLFNNPRVSLVLLYTMGSVMKIIQYARNKILY